MLSVYYPRSPPAYRRLADYVSSTSRYYITQEVRLTFT